MQNIQMVLGMPAHHKRDRPHGRWMVVNQAAAKPGFGIEMLQQIQLGSANRFEFREQLGERTAIEIRGSHEIVLVERR